MSWRHQSLNSLFISVALSIISLSSVWSGNDVIKGNESHSKDGEQFVREYFVLVSMWIYAAHEGDNWIGDCFEQTAMCRTRLRRMFHSVFRDTQLEFSFRTADCTYNGLHEIYPAAFVHLRFEANSYIEYDHPDHDLHETTIANLMRPKLSAEDLRLKVLYVRYPTEMGITRFAIDSLLHLENQGVITWNVTYFEEDPARELRDDARNQIEHAVDELNWLKHENITFSYIYPSWNGVGIRFLIELPTFRLPYDKSLISVVNDVKEALVRAEHCCRMRMTNIFVEALDGTWLSPKPAWRGEKLPPVSLSIGWKAYMGTDKGYIRWPNVTDWREIPYLKRLWYHVEHHVHRSYDRFTKDGSKTDVYLLNHYNHFGRLAARIYFTIQRESLTTERDTSKEFLLMDASIKGTFEDVGIIDGLLGASFPWS